MPIVNKVTVYQYIVVDPYRIERRRSRRWGTREGIESLKDFAEILESTAIEVEFGRRLVGVHRVGLQPNSRLTALPCLRPSGEANVVLAASLDLLRGDGEQYRLALGAE
jgi:hypothetical protein